LTPTLARKAAIVPMLMGRLEGLGRMPRRVGA
jgi:hypothetical protein